jgi:transposase
MISQLTRYGVQLLLRAGHTERDTAKRLLVSLSTVQRVAREPDIEQIDEEAERARRKVGRPSVAQPYANLVETLLKEDPAMLSVEALRRVRLAGYAGGKSALFALVASLRPPQQEPLMMRFEGLPGEFSQHDFGEVRVRFIDGSRRLVRFFASRLKWSRWVAVTLVDNEVVETLVRQLAHHFAGFGGVPLCAVFDRPKTVALHWSDDGVVTEWNPTFAYAALELGFTAEVCWPHQPRQKGAVENLVGWVKGSFFKQRRFHDMDDLAAQLAQWVEEVNTQRPSRATGQIPLERMQQQERKRLRPLRVAPSELALRVPVQVGPTAEVFYDGRGYAMPPEAAQLPATLYLYENRVKIVAGRWQAEHERFIPKGQIARQPEHRAAHLAAVAGTRGKRYLARQQLFECGQATVAVLTEIVHRSPTNWYPEVAQLHELLQSVGSENIERACRAAVAAGRFTVPFIEQCLGWPPTPASTAARVPA